VRKGFTLVEILVSIGIFVIAATVMLGALFGATEVFRRGEAARQAGDEATSVLAALQEDLSRATPIRLREGVPAREWGRLWANVGVAGNCRLELVVENPDRSQVRWIPNDSDPNRKLVGMRKRVVWFVDTTDPEPVNHILVREEWDITEDGTTVDTSGVQVGWPSSPLQTPLRTDVITRGVLHFGTWIEVAQAHRLVAAGPDVQWESTVNPVLPFGGSAFDSNDLETRAPPAFYPQPDAIRISIVLTGGGRYATRGTLVDPTNFRVSGIKALPTTSGSLLRVGDEWVRYDNFNKGMVIGVQRAQLRSTQGSPARGDLVLAGQPFSLVVALPK
jgi:prepilin-type N-terminal cleavage/methylation domain-containing protein